MRRRTKLALVALFPLGALVILAVQSLSAAGAFRTVEEHGPTALAQVSGFSGGTEDVVFRPGSNQVYVSSGNFRDPAHRGAIYLVDLAALGSAPVDVTPKLDFPFQPHGLDLWQAPEGNERLFVVNHRNGSGFTTSTGATEATHTVEVFDVETGGRLVHVRTVEGDALVSPNDVAAVGAEQFYVTNDHGMPPGFRRSLEDWLRLPLGNVEYFDGEQFREVLDGLQYPNGVAVSNDGQQIYVAETTGGRLRELRRDGASGELSQTWKSDFYTGLDNIDVAPDGSLWIGAHPKLLDFLAHAHDPSKRSPSQVLHATKDGNIWSIDEYWLEAGDQMSGSSVAASNGELVVVGSVFEPSLIVLPRR